MAKRRIIGLPWGTPPDQNESGDYHVGDVTNALYTGIVREVEIYCLSAGEAKPNIYDAPAGIGDALLWADNTGTTTLAGQWNAVGGVLSLPVTGGNPYLVGAFVNNTGVGTYGAVAGARGWDNPATYDGATAPNPLVGGSYFSGYGVGLRANGYIPPTISSVDGDNVISVGQTGVTLAGTDLLDDSGNAVFQLCNDAVYDNATEVVTQTFNSQTDTTLNFDVVQGGLALGTVYGFVTTGLGQRNTTGFNITLAASTGNSTTVSGQVPRPVGSILIEQKNPTTVSGQVPRPVGSILILNEDLTTNPVLVLGQVPRPVGSILIEQKNLTTVLGQVPRPVGSISISNISIQLSPLLEMDMLMYFQNEMIGATLSKGLGGVYNEEGVWVASFDSELPVKIIVPQPVTGRDMSILPQGEHTRHFQVSWIQSISLKTREYFEDADRITINSEIFKIHRINDRRTLGNFIKFFIREIRDDN